MVEAFIGTWKMTSSENFDEYMKAIGKVLLFKIKLFLMKDVACRSRTLLKLAR